MAVSAILRRCETARGPTIEVFITLAGEVKSASAALDGRDVLTLTSDGVARTVALVRYLAAHDADDLSRLSR